ncbi:MAG: glycosyltransferase family 2 protein [Spirochaetia bacterium]|jgi:dolichol-phosphate mannosyltransferase|nr:glycosyltransferase family 2 protein [Spirochaetia bacterium]
MLLSIVIPIMNEEGNIELVTAKIIEVIEKISDYEYELIFVDDGSTDNSLLLLKKLHAHNKKIKYISFSRNFGHQNALKAGLDYAQGDCVISMDGDMQHPPELIPAMIAKWRKDGYDIVYTVRKDDPKLGYFKKISSYLFYKFMNLFSDINIEPGSADFRLLNKTVVQVIKQLHENPLFFRGIIPWVGFKQCAIEYVPNERFWGASKYSLKKMMNFAITGISSFSIKPLMLSAYCGFFISLTAFCYGLYAIFTKIFTDTVISGWTSTLVIVSFIGGIQLIVMGIIGIYLGKLFMEFKGRPEYIIREKSDE